MGFSRQEYWSGLSLPSPVDLPHPGIEPTGGLYHWATWEAHYWLLAETVQNPCAGKDLNRILTNLCIRNSGQERWRDLQDTRGEWRAELRFKPRWWVWCQCLPSYNVKSQCLLSDGCLPWLAWKSACKNLQRKRGREKSRLQGKKKPVSICHRSSRSGLARQHYIPLPSQRSTVHTFSTSSNPLLPSKLLLWCFV